MRQTSYGKCFFCERPFPKQAILRHLRSCPVRKEAIAREPQSKGRPARLFHLKIEGRYAPEYWLHIEIPAASTLYNLDSFLRAIWVECCGHLSAFTIEDVEYLEDAGMVDGMWPLFSLRQRPKTMNAPLYRILRPGLKFFYDYDFGTTTRLTLGMVEERHGQVPEKGVRILARNYAPLYRCIHCQEKAQYIDTYEYTTYCDRHAREHEDWPDRFLPLVNLPRTGNCAYTGPRPGSPYLFEECYTPNP